MRYRTWAVSYPGYGHLRIREHRHEVNSYAMPCFVKSRRAFRSSSLALDISRCRPLSGQVHLHARRRSAQVRSIGPTLMPRSGCGSTCGAPSASPRRRRYPSMRPHWCRFSASKPTGQIVAASACAPVSTAPSRTASLRSAPRRSAWLRSARCRFAP
jgi:hypothetical protein